MAKHTPGPWKYGRHVGSHFTETGYIEFPDGSGFPIGCSDEHGRLIAEAGTVEAETGLTPRQLADQRAELLWFAEQIFNGLDTGLIKIETAADETLANVLAKGRAAIAKATAA